MEPRQTKGKASPINILVWGGGSLVPPFSRDVIGTEESTLSHYQAHNRVNVVDATWTWRSAVFGRSLRGTVAARSTVHYAKCCSSLLMSLTLTQLCIWTHAALHSLNRSQLAFQIDYVSVCYVRYVAQQGRHHEVKINCKGRRVWARSSKNRRYSTK